MWRLPSASGSARLAQEAQEQASQSSRQQEVERRQIELELMRKTLEVQIAAMRAEFAVQEVGLLKIIGQEQAQEAQLVQERVDMGLSRKADKTPNKHKGVSK